MIGATCPQTTGKSYASKCASNGSDKTFSPSANPGTWRCRLGANFPLKNVSGCATNCGNNRTDEGIAAVVAGAAKTEANAPGW